MVRLMLADDEAVITTQLERRLSLMGYDIVGTASSGEESVELARELKPALILMDIVMPGRLDGIDAAEIIKNELDIPIIFLTAYTDDKLINRAKEIGPFGYIVKPFKEHEIKATVEIALHKKCIEQHQKQAVEQIRKLSNVVEQNPCMIVVTDLKGDVVYVNPRFTQFTGYTSNEVIGENIRFLKSGEIPPEVYKELWDTIASGKEWIGEFCNRKKNGEQYWELVIISAIRSTEDTISHYFAVKIEISRQKQKEEQTKALLEEKETLLKETHHRVKNNMNVIISLISMQSQSINDKQFLSMFKECENRIRSMAIIHEELYQTENLKRIDFTRYIRNLTNHILDSYEVHTDKFSMNMNVENISLDSKNAIPCGLIINELLSNTIKYAFPFDTAQGKPEGKKGEITISMHRIADIGLQNADLKSEIPDPKSEMRNAKSEIELIVSDNGVGLPEDLDFKNSKSLGLELVNGLTQQLGGTIELDRSKGTEFKITFEA